MINKTIHRFVERSREGQNAPWRTLVGIAVVLCAFMIGLVPFEMYKARLIRRSTLQSDELLAYIEVQDYSAIGGSQYVAYILQLLPFSLAFIALYMVMKYLHRRRYISLVHLPQIDLRRLSRGFLWTFGMLFLADLCLNIMGKSEWIWQFQWQQWIPFLLISLVFLLVQTTIEELFIRGYLYQWVGRNTQWSWIPAIFTAIVFTLLHIGNPELHQYGTLAFLAYLITGLFYGFIVFWDDRLELPLGMHFANNLYAILIVNYKGSALSSPSMILSYDLDIRAVLILQMIVMLVLTALFALKYRWKIFSVNTPGGSDQEEVIS